MYLKSPLNVLVIISALLKWTSAGVALNFCVWTKIMSNGEAHHSFLRHDETQRSLRLYHSVWTKEKSLVNCAWNDESAVTKNYMSVCKRRGRDFTEHPTDEHFDINLMLELNSPCVAVTSTSTVAEGAERTWGRHARSPEEHRVRVSRTRGRHARSTEEHRVRVSRTRGRHARSTEEHRVGVSVQNLHGDAESPERGTHRRVKRGFIVPGTLWCGSGDKATSYSDLGVFFQTDSCCREHDQCQETIMSFQSRYGVFNLNIFTMSHCDCDERFRECLRWSEDSISDVVGYTFFNLLQLRCFELTHTLQCVQRNWFGMCRLEEMTLSAVVYPATLYNSTNPDSDDDNMATTSMDIDVTSQTNLTADPQKSNTSEPDTHTAASSFLASDTSDLAIHPAASSSPASDTSDPAIHTAASSSPASTTSRTDTNTVASSFLASDTSDPAIHTAASSSPASTTSRTDTHTAASSSPASTTSRTDTHTAASSSPASTTSRTDTHTAASSSPASTTSEPAIHTAASSSPASTTSEPAIHTAASSSPASTTIRTDTHTAASSSPASTTSEPDTHTAASSSPASATSEPDTHTAASSSPASTTSRTDTHTAASSSPASTTSRTDTHTAASSSPASTTSRTDTHTAASSSPASTTSRTDTHTSASSSPASTTYRTDTHTAASSSPASTTSEPAIHTAASSSPALSVTRPTPGTNGSNLDLSTPGRETRKENRPPTQDPSAARTTKPTTYTNLPLPGQATAHTDGKQSCELYRDLDDCRLKIPPQQERYGLHNPESRSLYHCNCTSRLFQALGQQKELSGLQSVLLDYLSQSCFTLQSQHCTASCTAVLVQPLLPRLELQQADGDMEERRHLQVLRLKVRRPNMRRAKRKDRSVRLYKLCLRMTRPKIPKTRRLHLLGAHSGLP